MRTSSGNSNNSYNFKKPPHPQFLMKKFPMVHLAIIRVIYQAKIYYKAYITPSQMDEQTFILQNTPNGNNNKRQQSLKAQEQTKKNTA